MAHGSGERTERGGLAEIFPGQETASARARRVARAALDVGVPLMLWGPPGVGKSSFLKAEAERRGWAFCRVDVTLRDPTEIAGVWLATPQGAAFEPPVWARRLAREAEEKQGGLLLLDDLTTAPPAVQDAALRVFEEGVLGDLVLPAAVRRVAAGNPPEQTASGSELAPALSNRMVHVEWPVPDLGEWTAELLSGGFGDNLQAPGWSQAAAEVAAFLHANPHLFHRLPQEGEPVRAWPSPRSWHMYAIPILARLGPEGLPAAVGPDAAAEFMAWREMGELPSVEQVLRDPRGVPIPRRHDARIFLALRVAGEVAAHGTRVEGCLAFLDRLAEEEAWDVARTALDVLRSSSRTSPYLARAVLSGKLPHLVEVVRWSMEAGVA